MSGSLLESGNKQSNDRITDQRGWEKVRCWGRWSAPEGWGENVLERWYTKRNVAPDWRMNHRPSTVFLDTAQQYSSGGWVARNTLISSPVIVKRNIAMVKQNIAPRSLRVSLYMGPIKRKKCGKIRNVCINLVKRDSCRSTLFLLYSKISKCANNGRVAWTLETPVAVVGYRMIVDTRCRAV